MLSLLDLETEVVSLILEFVDDSSPRSTKAVACVNRYFNELTRAIAHRHKVIDLDGTFTDEVYKHIEAWCSDNLTVANIRTLTIKGRLLKVPDEDENGLEENASEDDEEDENDENIPSEERARPTPQIASEHDRWLPLVTLLSKIGKLRQFDWSIRYPIPLPVLDAFERYQKWSTIRIFNFVREDGRSEVLGPVEWRLAKSKALVHIRTVVEAEPWAARQLSDLQELAFRGIIASAPRLEYARFLVRNSFSMDEERVADIERWRSAFNPRNKLSSSVKQLTIDGVSMSKRTLDDWSSTIDLTVIEQLKFSRGLPSLDFFQSAATMLPKLNRLFLNLRNVKGWINRQEGGKMIPAIQNYVTTCAPLQTLSLWSWMDVVPLSEILERHGETLLDLQLHERETGNGMDRQILAVEDVRAIRLSCPKLKAFTFDLARQDQQLRWERDRNRRYYEELAKFEHLDHLQIYFDSGTAHMFAPNNQFDLYDVSSDEDDGSNNQEQANTDGTNAHTGGTTTNFDPLTTMLSYPSSSSNPPSNSSSTSNPVNDEPATKRARTTKNIAPSLDTDLTGYMAKVWTAVFGNRLGGARRLEVKVGEWEGAHYGMEQQAKRLILVRPNERDDVREPDVTVHKKS